MQAYCSAGTDVLQKVCNPGQKWDSEIQSFGATSRNAQSALIFQ